MSSRNPKPVVSTGGSRGERSSSPPPSPVRGNSPRRRTATTTSTTTRTTMRTPLKWSVSIFLLCVVSVFVSISYSRMLPSSRQTELSTADLYLFHPGTYFNENDKNNSDINNNNKHPLATSQSWSLLHRYFEKGLIDPDVESGERIYWLLSFPNSGTTYTVENVERMSYTSTAVNYESESDALTPLIPDRPDGPFARNTSLSLPEYVLVKTHCACYCDSCNMGKSFCSPDDFEVGCGRSDKLINGNITDIWYPSTLAKKVVHLVRAPLDNLVSRMHHGIYRRRMFLNWTDDQLAPFSSTREGILKWCSHIDRPFFNRRAQRDSGHKYADDVRRLVASLPCGSDIYRYVQWHNNACQLTTKMGVPVHVLFYEDYALHLNETVQDLFRFLDLPMVNPSLPFLAGKTYDYLFDDDYRDRAWELIRRLSSNATWNLLQRYFPIGLATDKIVASRRRLLRVSV